MSYVFGFIGCGTMGNVLINGIMREKLLEPDQIIIYDNLISKTKQFEKEGVSVASSLKELCQKSNFLFMVVKPQDLGDLLREIAAFLHKNQVIVSVVAGASTAFIEENLNNNMKVIRIMPNTPCLVNEGMIALCSGAGVDKKDIEIVIKILKPLGKIVVTDESLMDAVTGLSGSGPAYVCLFLEALIDGGVEVGLPRDLASLLAVQTVLGTAKMVQQTGKLPAELKNMVTSPGGTTSGGLLVLEENRVRASLISAVKKSTARARELSK